MSHPLDGCSEKLKRAEEHLNILAREIAGWREFHEQRLIREFEPETQHYVFRTTNVVEIPPRISIICGEIVHQVRSVYDHAICALVTAYRAPLGKKHGFPVFDNAQAYVATTRVKIQGIPPGSSAEALILRLQPYDAAQRAIRTKDPIYILDALDVIDKHRLLLLIGSSIRAQSIRYGPMVSFEVFPKNRGTIAEEGAEVFRVVQAFANQPPMDVEIHPSFDIAFREPEVIEGQPIIPILEELINSTRQVVGLFGSVFPQ